MQLRQSFFVAIISFVALVLVACNKKPVSRPSQKVSDTGSVFVRPSLSELKQSTVPLAGAQEPQQEQRCGKHYASIQRYKESCAEVPLPVGALTTTEYSDAVYGADLVRARVTSLSQQELYQFYVGVLEQTGWSLYANIIGCGEQLVIWEKPSQVCAISIRPLSYMQRRQHRSQKTLLVIHQGKKQADCR